MSAKPSVAALEAGWTKAGRAVEFQLATRAMGWHISFIPPAYQGHFGWEPGWSGPGAPTINGGLWLDWSPLRKPEHLEMCREAIRTAGLSAQYAEALIRQLGWDPGRIDALTAVSHLVYATSEHHCKAMLSALDTLKS